MNYGLKCCIKHKNVEITLSGRSKREEPASAFRKKVVPVFGPFTYLSTFWEIKWIGDY
jgi:hypothetical protein